MSKTSPRFTDRVRAAAAAGEPLPLIRGGDGSTEPTLPRTPEGDLDRAALSALTDAEVGELHVELQAFYDEARPAATTVEAATTLKPFVEAMLALREIAAERWAAAEGNPDADAALSALDDLLTVTPPAGDPAPAPSTEPGDGGDPAPTTAAAAPVIQVTAEALRELIGMAAVTASAVLDPLTADGLAPLPTARVLSPARVENVAIRPTTTITASGEVPGYTAGDDLDGLLEVSKALIKKRDAIGQPGTLSGQDLCPVATFKAEWPEERYLKKTDNLLTIQEKVAGVAGAEAIVASGGLCAPVQPYYEIMTIAQAARPVRDALASFMADRGGIRLIPPPQLADAAGSIGFITAAVDAAALGGSGGQISAATKPCIHAACPGAVETDLAAVTRCLEFGNFTTRAYPEQVVAWVTLSMAQHARKGETALLDGIAAASTQVTAAKVVGATRDIIAGIVKMAAYYRNHNRTLADAVLRVLMPAWVIDLMVADLTHGSGYEAEFLTMARREIEDALNELAINVTFYIDSGTGKGQLINNGAAQAAGAAVAFPSTVVWYLFAEGSFLFLDGGTLDLGIVRDSALNSLNNYRMFAESFEAVAFVGVESIEVTQTVVADGTFAGTAYGSSTVSSPVALPTAY